MVAVVFHDAVTSKLVGEFPDEVLARHVADAVASRDGRHPNEFDVRSLDDARSLCAGRAYQPRPVK